MKKIGIAASKMAKGNLILYNIFVLFISFFLSLFIFFISGTVIVIGLVSIGFVLKGILPPSFEDSWISLLRVCLISLAFVVGIFNLLALLINMRIMRRKL